MSYRNIYYDSYNKQINLFTWDEMGNRVMRTLPYSPYLYLDSERGECKSIYGNKVTCKEFSNGYERYKFLKDSKIKRVYENFNPVQQFLIDNYWQLNETPEFGKNQLKVVFFDIETYSKGSFPNIDDADHEIIAITCYDSLSKKYNVYGSRGDYTPLRDDVVYHHCENERQLLLRFLSYIEDDYPDILTGWNSEGFDVPYTTNRITKILGANEVLRLSPVGKIRDKTIINFGKENVIYFYEGISMMDYLNVYKKFCYKMRESYKLDAIGEVELGERKIDYGNKQLWELADDDWQTFIDYNVQDVVLLVNLEEKLKYLDLVKMLAYIGCSTFESALGTIGVVTGALAVVGKRRGVVLPTFVTEKKSTKLHGAYVAEPIRGFSDNIVSYDLNSLYPMTMVTLNLSMETKVGKLSRSDDGRFELKHVSGRSMTLSKDNLTKYLHNEKCSISPSGFIFSQKKKGLIPEFIDYYYNKRVEVKKSLFVERQKLKSLSENGGSESEISECIDEVQRLDTLQWVVKILLNSTYGTLGNQYSQVTYDPDISNSVTLTGQAVIKKSALILQDYLAENYDIKDKKVLDGTRVYGDTDSIYVSLGCISDKVPIKGDDGKISKEFYDLTLDMEDYLNRKLVEWSKNSMKTIDCRLHFKREAIVDNGLFVQKKRYVLHVLDDEGIACDKFKYTGLEVVRTSMPNALKPHAKNIIEVMLINQDEREINDMLMEAYEIFKGMPYEDIAFVMGIGNYEKSKAKCDGFSIGKGVPIHVKAAIYHNEVLERLGLESKCEKIGTNDKIRYFYVEQPNKYHVNVIGFKYVWEPEFDALFKMDHSLMFEKIFFNPIDRLMKSVGWTSIKPANVRNCNILDIFG